MDYFDIKPEFKGDYDVIVVGGGIAGISASVSAARRGANVLLIEKQVNLGGLATGGLISWYEPLCDGEGNQMIYGIAEELIELSVQYCFDMGNGILSILKVIWIYRIIYLKYHIQKSCRFHPVGNVIIMVRSNIQT